jgi:hypothetical protein
MKLACEVAVAEEMQNAHGEQVLSARDGNTVHLWN